MLDAGVCSTPRPSSFTPRKESRCPLYTRVGGPQGRSGHVRKISPTTGFDPRPVQPVASRYTHYATRPTIRSPSRPARSESLYRLRYPGLPFFVNTGQRKKHISYNLTELLSQIWQPCAEWADYDSRPVKQQCCAN